MLGYIECWSLGVLERGKIKENGGKTRLLEGSLDSGVEGDPWIWLLRDSVSLNFISLSLNFLINKMGIIFSSSQRIE